MDVRTDYETGKLLFQWDPQNNIISIVHKDMMYKIQLLRNSDSHTYKIVDKRNKRDLTSK